MRDSALRADVGESGRAELVVTGPAPDAVGSPGSGRDPKLPQRASARTGPSDAPRRSASAGRHPGDGRPRGRAASRRPRRRLRRACLARAPGGPRRSPREHVAPARQPWRHRRRRRSSSQSNRACDRARSDGVRRALVLGVVLGEDEGLPEDVKQDFRASGLAHLLAVSGQNVAYIAIGIFGLGWLLRIPRVFRELMTLGAIAAYVLAVGWQPSVIRAGVAGALASLAWLAARPRDRWHFLAVGALVLLAWTPTSLLEPGFQLSFAAVAGIFVGVPRLNARLDGYPVPRGARDVLGVALVAVSSRRRSSSFTSVRHPSTPFPRMPWRSRRCPRCSAWDCSPPRRIPSLRCRLGSRLAGGLGGGVARARRASRRFAAGRAG